MYVNNKADYDLRSGTLQGSSGSSLVFLLISLNFNVL